MKALATAGFAVLAACAAAAVLELPVYENASVTGKTALAGSSVSPTNSVKAADGEKPRAPVKITSDSTFYDRKGGYAVFTGRVHVDDEQCQFHADKAFVFLSETNDLKRLVAVGNVAVTNEMRRAYGEKVLYYRQNGMVVLYAPPGGVAEIRDESKGEDQIVRGSKIKFWTKTEQVEVIKADITSPVSGGDRKDFMKNLR